jgi:hypothetical protein
MAIGPWHMLRVYSGYPEICIVLADLQHECKKIHEDYVHIAPSELLSNDHKLNWLLLNNEFRFLIFYNASLGN